MGSYVHGNILQQEMTIPIGKGRLIDWFLDLWVREELETFLSTIGWKMFLKEWCLIDFCLRDGNSTEIVYFTNSRIIRRSMVFTFIPRYHQAQEIYAFVFLPFKTSISPLYYPSRLQCLLGIPDPQDSIYIAFDFGLFQSLVTDPWCCNNWAGRNIQIRLVQFSGNPGGDWPNTIWLFLFPLFCSLHIVTHWLKQPASGRDWWGLTNLPPSGGFLLKWIHLDVVRRLTLS